MITSACLFCTRNIVQDPVHFWSVPDCPEGSESK